MECLSVVRTLRGQQALFSGSLRQIFIPLRRLSCISGGSNLAAGRKVAAAVGDLSCRDGERLPPFAQIDDRFSHRMQSASILPNCKLSQAGTDTVPNALPLTNRRQRPDLRQAWVSCCVLLAGLFLNGCHSAPATTYSTELPAQHTVNSKHLVIHSNAKLDADNVLVQELEDLRDRVFTTLQLPAQRDPVHVYLFSDEASYRYYMNTTWQNLPPRRAYFVGTARELAVYSFLGSKVQEDLRHEFTHGLLHATLKSVPLWLDEGLAEYFEVDANIPEAVHAEHVREWEIALQENWSPNLFRLEMLTDFRDMTQRDYAESWGWVH